MKQILSDFLLNPSKPMESIFHILTLILVLWSINPQSLHYNWAIWGALMLLWLLLAVAISKGDVISQFFKRHLYIILLWPAMNLLLQFFSNGKFSTKQVSLTLTMLIPWFYIIYQKKQVLATIARVALGYLTIIALTTLVQYITYPEIARDLAGLEKGLLRSSPVLGNFDTVYQAVPLIIMLTGLFVYSLSKQAKGRNKETLFFGSALMIQIPFVVFSRYRIALLMTVVFFILNLSLMWFKKYRLRQGELKEDGYLESETSKTSKSRTEKEIKSRKDSLPIDKNKKRLKTMGENEPGWILLLLALYTLPAALLLIFKDLVFRVIYLADLRLLRSSVSLVNRLRVYLKSIILYLDYPIRGISALADRANLELGYHSDYFDVLGEFGLVGFLVLMGLWIAMLYRIKNQTANQHQSLYSLSVLSFLILMFVNPVLEVSAVILFMVILPGLSWSIQSEPHSDRIIKK